MSIKCRQHTSSVGSPDKQQTYSELRTNTTNCVIDPSLVESQETRSVTAARNAHFGSWLQQLTDSMDELYPNVQVKPYLLHGAEAFLRNQQFFSYSKLFRHFMVPNGSLPHSQVPATCPYPEPKYQSRSEAYSLAVSQHMSLL
jgi:hypothetical protein